MSPSDGISVDDIFDVVDDISDVSEVSDVLDVDSDSVFLGNLDGFLDDSLGGVFDVFLNDLLGGLLNVLNSLDNLLDRFLGSGDSLDNS